MAGLLWYRSYLHQYYADTAGYYPDMQAGQTDAVMELSMNRAFVSKDIPPSGFTEVEPVIVGGTVVWNQLLQNGDFASTTGWSTQNAYASFSVSDNIGTMSLIDDPANAYMPYLRGTASLANVQNHVVLFRAAIKPDRGGYFRVEYAGGGFGARFNTPLTANAWNNVEKILKRTNAVTETNTIVTYPENMVVNGWVSGDTWQIKNFTAVDLTQMFGSTIADYVYSLEQTETGSGLEWLNKIGFFTEDYYAYNTGTLESVNTSAHVIKDAEDNVVHTYSLDSSLTLLGLPKVSDDGVFYFDGDTYESDGTVTRNYGSRAYAAGDESLTDAITDGTTTVYKLTTATTETANTFTSPQEIEPDGSESYTDYAYTQSSRDFEMPTGNISTYRIGD